MLLRKVLITIVVAVGVHTISANGLPGEYILSQSWRDIFNRYSPLTNAAALTEENYLSVRTVFSPILGGEFKLWEGGIIVPIGLYQSLGITGVVQDDGFVTNAGYIDGDRLVVQSGNSRIFNNNYFFMLTYAQNILGKLSIGVNINVAYQTNYGKPIMGLGADIGLTYRIVNDPVIGEHLFGLATVNALSPSMEKTFAIKPGNPGEYASAINASLHSYFLQKKVESGIVVNIKDIKPNSSEFVNNNGAAALKKLEWNLSAHAGVTLLKFFKIYALLGSKNSMPVDYYGGALGINMASSNNGRDLDMLYQYIVKPEEFGATGHTFYVKTDIGQHRDEKHSDKITRLSSLKPNDLYTKARKLHSDKKYWDAFFLFSRIQAEHPDFFKNDWVSYYRANCLEEMDMREQAIENYLHTKNTYGLSTASHLAELGLIRVYYRNSDHFKVAAHYTSLKRPQVTDSIRFVGAYIAGQSYFQTKDTRKSIELLSLIPESHPDYIFAQHSIAVSHIVLDDPLENAVAALENCIGFEPSTTEQKEIKNRSYVLLGYLYYEKGLLSKAILSLREVPLSSFYAEDALLGQGWTALKAGNLNDCIATGESLAKTSGNEVLKCEGLLIWAYGHILKKEYTSALPILENALLKAKLLSPMNTDSLTLLKMQYQNTRLEYGFFAERLENISKVGQNSAKITVVDSLENQKDAFVTKIKEYLKTNDASIRHAVFERTINDVKADIEYALAKVQNLTGSNSGWKTQQKNEQKEQNINSEIEKLRLEMEKLQGEN